MFQMNEIGGEEDIQEWGLSMFGDQVYFPFLKCCFQSKRLVSKDLSFLM